jgi:hypothetical protein
LKIELKEKIAYGVPRYYPQCEPGAILLQAFSVGKRKRLCLTVEQLEMLKSIGMQFDIKFVEEK